MQQGFVTASLAIWLDLIRVLAALTVLLGHAVQLGLYTGPFPFTIALQQNAVIVFFVLSGLLVAGSAERAGGLGRYVIARASRIVPVALAAIVVSLAVAALDVMTSAEALYPEHKNWRDKAALLGAVFFLSESWAPYFALNPPFWSLCYEVWFYALFGAALFTRGLWQIAWLAVLGLVAGPNVLLLLPCWLLGVWLHRVNPQVPRHLARPAIMVGLAGLAIAPHLAEPGQKLLMSIATWDLGHALYAPSYLFLALCVTIGLAGLRTLTISGWSVPAPLCVPVRRLADISFSLYILHWPLLKLSRMMGVAPGTNFLSFLAVLALTIGASAVFAWCTEARRPALRAWLENRRDGAAALSAH